MYITRYSVHTSQDYRIYITLYNVNIQNKNNEFTSQDIEHTCTNKIIKLC